MSDAIYMLIIVMMMGTFAYWYHINKCDLCIEYHKTHSSYKKQKKRKKKSNLKKKVSFTPESDKDDDSLDL